MSAHICSSYVGEGEGLRRVCGICWFVHEGCRCYAVDDLGIVMRESKTAWTANLGLDLMERGKYLGTFKTRKEAVEAIREKG